jgi:DNA modification methylase
MLDDVFAELDRVTTANAHVYVFFSMTYYEQVVEIAESYFSVNRTPLIWAKNNHAPSAPGANGFEKGYAQKYEPILFCRGPNGDSRPLRPESGGVCPNVLNHARPSGQERRHDTQKPQSLLRELITNSSAVGETVLDPFAGSGSTLLAAAAADRHYVGFELDEDYESGFQREMRQIKGGDAL